MAHDNAPLLKKRPAKTSRCLKSGLIWWIDYSIPPLWCPAWKVMSRHAYYMRVNVDVVSNYDALT